MYLLRFPYLSAALLAVMTLAVSGVGQAADKAPTVMYPVRHDVSRPMRDIIRTLPLQLSREGEERPMPNIFLRPSLPILAKQPDLHYPGIQRIPSTVAAPPLGLSFDAIDQISSNCGCLPPDTNGDVGENEYIQWVNTSWAVYDKTDGSLLSGPTPGNSFWADFGGKCETSNEGDPLVVYDQVAKRWVMSQFVTTSPFAQCVAVSTSSDPLGSYYRYEFNWPYFGDYGKLSVWADDSGSQDAYLLTTHEFDDNDAFQGAAFIAMERDKMLAGDPNAALIRYPGYNAYGVQPINLTGTLKAPANACPAFVHFDESTSDYLFWDLCLDWATPADSHITTNNAATRIAASTPFSPYYNAVAQPETSEGLASFGSNVMYRATARAFPVGAPFRVALVINHVVQAGSDNGGIRWVEFDLGDQNAPPAQPTPLAKRIVDDGVFAPDDDTRWMGAVAIDSSGNLGLGYSVSSTQTHPQIRVTGRTLSDDAGMLRDEQTCTDGIANGSQTHTADRWGDYSSMNVDPSDQCTFWFTTEYYPTTSTLQWHTRVCSFKFADCGKPDYVLSSTSPVRLEMCTLGTASDPSYGLRTAVLNGFSDSVTLSLANAPPGTSATFTSNPVGAPGQSSLTLTGSTSLASGEYAFSAQGSSATLLHSLPLQLGISAELPQQPELLVPVDVASNVRIRPVLNWSTVGASDRIFGDGYDGTSLPPIGQPSTAISYTVEVASDPAFANLVASNELPEQTWTVDTLLISNSMYYWRVTAHNYCGDSTVSNTFSFTTGTPGMCPTGTTASTVFEDDFSQGVHGWTTSGSGAVGWTQKTRIRGTVWQIPDNDSASDHSLTSPAIAIPGGAQAVILSYDTFHSFETDGSNGCYDNASLALSNDNGASFDYLGPARMFTDSYDGIAASTTALSGKYVWCQPGSSGTSARSHAIVDLDDYAGQNVRIRFRAASDSNTAAPAPNGMLISNFKLQVCQ